MKKLKELKSIFYLTLVAVLFTSFSITSCKTETEVEEVTLNQQEKDMLIQMREEEKLARDVYDSLFVAHGTRVFDNISNSEQRHMDDVLGLLNKYNLPDPASPTPGVFNNPDLQNLYNQLVTAGSVSEIEALKVGATIEDLDIYDLEEFSSMTDKQDILDVFGSLDCGSQNHMRAFMRQLTNAGETYTPQFITQAKFDAILNGTNGSCN
jgi:hypothetical protein